MIKRKEGRGRGTSLGDHPAKGADKGAEKAPAAAAKGAEKSSGCPKGGDKGPRRRPRKRSRPERVVLDAKGPRSVKIKAVTRHQD